MGPGGYGPQPWNGSPAQHPAGEPQTSGVFAATLKFLGLVDSATDRDLFGMPRQTAHPGRATSDDVRAKVEALRRDLEQVHRRLERLDRRLRG